MELHGNIILKKKAVKTQLYKILWFNDVFLKQNKIEKCLKSFWLKTEPILLFQKYVTQMIFPFTRMYDTHSNNGSKQFN